MNSRRAFLSILITAALAAPASAAELININTADSATLQTLTGIGPSKAQGVIDYRTQNGPFAAIEDIMNVSGIGAATYNGIKDFITVGSSGGDTQSQSSSPPPSAPVTTSASAQTAAPVPEITARIVGAGTVSAGAGSFFVAEALNNAGVPISSGVRYIWNFGDGTSAEGKSVFHTYAYPASYAVVLTVGYSYSSTIVRAIVEAVAPEVVLIVQSDGSVTVENAGAEELNVGGWSLRDGTKRYVIPDDTYILAGGGIRFSPALLGFSGSASTALHYPNGEPAAAGKPAADSPLRGQQVSAAEISAMKRAPSAPAPVAAAPEKTSGEPAPELSAAVAQTGAGTASGRAFWFSIAGLAGVLAAGVGVTRYLQPKREETSLTADEFEIEE